MLTANLLLEVLRKDSNISLGSSALLEPASTTSHVDAASLWDFSQVQFCRGSLNFPYT